MDLKCFQIPFKAHFLKHFSKLLIEKHSSSLPDLSGIVVIFPSKRIKYYFRRELLSSAGINGIFPPVIYSLDELIEKLYSEISPLKKASQLYGSSLIHKAVIEKKTEFTASFNVKDEINITDFSRFYPFSLKIINLFDELETEDVTFNKLKIKGVYSDYEERINVLKDVYSSYGEMLSAGNYITRGQILKSAIDGKSLSSFGRMYKSVYFAGFTFLTEIEKRLFLKISESVAGASFVIHSGNEDSHSKLIKQFNLKPEKIAADERKPEIKVFEAKSDAAQVSFVIESINELHKKGISPSSISLIVPDASIIPLIVQSFKNYGIPFNITAGLSLKSTPVYSLLKTLCSLFNERPFYHKHLLSLISHPYIKNLTFKGCNLKSQCYTLSAFVRNGSIVYLNYEENKDNIKFKELLLFINSSCNSFLKIKSLSDFSEFIREFLLKLQFVEGEVLGGYFNEYCSAIFNLLNDFEVSDLPFDAPYDFFAFFLSLLAGKKVNLFGNPFEGVQVMGLLEARNLDFKAKIITSLNEGSFPPPEGKDIFLNSRVRKSAGLPSAADRETLYKYMFEELTLSSDFCYISYKSDASFIFEKSRFVEKLIKNGINKKPASTRHFLPFCPESKVEFLFTEVKKGDLVEQLKNLTYTPSMIKDFLECSYRFYIKHILRIAESPEIMEELERRDYGNLLHRVMNRFFKIEEFKYGISPLLEKKGFEAVVRLISEEVNKEANLSAADRMAFELLKGEMRRWVKKEALLFKKGHRVEGEFSESRIDVILLCNGLSIKLSGRPDRVNSFNGGYYLIDYKVKNLPTSNEMLINESFKEVQLPFYGLLLMLSRKLDYSEIKGLAYYDLKKDFSLTEVLSESSAGYMQSFKTFLEEIFTSLFNTETPFSLTEDRKNCRYCSFPGICRVKQK